MTGAPFRAGAAARVTVTGTQADPVAVWGAPNTGRRFERPVWKMRHMACGKLSEGWILPDNLTMLRQLGCASWGSSPTTS